MFKRKINIIILLFCVISIYLPSQASAGWWGWKKGYSDNYVTTNASMYVNVEALNVRSCPATKCLTKTVTYYGDRVFVYGSKHGWYKIKTPRGVIGWASASYIQHSHPGRIAAPPAPTVRNPDSENMVVQNNHQDPVVSSNTVIINLDDLTESIDLQASGSAPPPPPEEEDIFNLDEGPVKE